MGEGGTVSVAVGGGGVVLGATVGEDGTVSVRVGGGGVVLDTTVGDEDAVSVRVGGGVALSTAVGVGDAASPISVTVAWAVGGLTVVADADARG